MPLLKYSSLIQFQLQKFLTQHDRTSFAQASLATDGALQKPSGMWHSEAGRASAGAAFVEWGGSYTCEIAAVTLGGAAVKGRQTVPRAELMAGAVAHMNIGPQ